MNCQDFLERMNDVARGALMDAAARAEAQAHQSACGVCAARLADDRTLSAGLKALAARDAAREASPRVEAALLAAFRARRAAPAVAPAGSCGPAASEAVAATHAETAPALAGAATLANVVSLDDARAPRRWTWRESLAAGGGGG
jgi:hypothetical protein